MIVRSSPLLSKLLATCVLGAVALLAGCVTTKSVVPTTYDLGTLGPYAPRTSAPDALRTNAVPPAIAPITVADVTTAAWLDSQMMYFRLSYENDQQPRPYQNSRWSMPPPQLLGQRIKARLSQTGGVVLSGTDGAVNVPLLRIEADDFTQRFSSPAESEVQVAVRASVFNGRTLVAQKSFRQKLAAPTPDAAGGASALAAATDLMIGDLIVWLAALPVKK